MRLNNPLKEEWLQTKNALWLKQWMFKQNQLPAIHIWFKKHTANIVLIFCLIVGTFVITRMLLRADFILQMRGVSQQAYKEGTKISCEKLKGKLQEQVTLKTCMEFYFGKDPDRIGKALRAGKL
jgi:hypothetical protein